MAKRALVVAFALVAVACSASERDAALKSQATAPGAAAAVGHDRSTVLALLSGGARTALARLDARTLRPIGRRIEVGGGRTVSRGSCQVLHSRRSRGFVSGLAFAQ